MAPDYPPTKLVTVLERVPLLHSCVSEDLFYLARHTEHLKKEARSVLIEAGKPVDSVYVLLQGRAAAVVRNVAQRSQQQLERLRPGDLFGDTAFLVGSATPISVIAESDCQILAIKVKAFEKVFVRSPDVILALAHRAAARFVRVSMLGVAPSSGPEPSLSPEAAPETAAAATVSRSSSSGNPRSRTVPPRTVRSRSGTPSSASWVEAGWRWSIERVTSPSVARWR